MRIFYISISLFILSASVSVAQIGPQFTQTSFFNNYLNPALTGADSKLHAFAAHRSQYVGLSDKMIGSQLLGFGMPVVTPKFGLGFNLVNDFIGQQRFTQVGISAAYHQTIKNKHKLSYGLTLGFVQFALNGDLLRAPDGSYLAGPNGTINPIHNDNLLPTEKISNLAFASSFGVNYAFKGLLVGVSMFNPLAAKVAVANNEETLFRNTRIINTYLKYVIELNKQMKLEPFVLYKTDFKKHQLDAQIIYYYKNILAGITFRGYAGRANDAIGAMFGVNIKQRFGLGYAFEYPLSFLNNNSSGTHEIRLGYELPMKFKSKSKGNVIHNPRFL